MACVIALLGLLGAARATPTAAAPAPVLPSTFDPTFGSGGKVITPLSVIINGIAVQPDGKIVALGSDTETDPKGDARLTRYTVDGVLDPSFGTGGVAHTDLGQNEGAVAAAFGSDGRIAVAESTASPPDEMRSNAFVARYHADGRIDSSFGDHGTTEQVGNGGFVAFDAVAVQADDKVLAGGAYGPGSGERVLLMRYNADGSVDSGFAAPVAGARVLTDAVTGCHVLALREMAGGAIMVAGSCDGGGVFGARLDATGHLDAAYGSGGAVVATYGVPAGGHAQGATILADGAVAFAGSLSPYRDTPNMHEFSVFRLTAGGTVDVGFGVAGVASSAVSDSQNALAYAIGAGPDGSLTVWGTASDPPGGEPYVPGRLFVAHLSGVGQFDPAFGPGGIATFVMGNQPRGQAGRAVVQADGRPVLSGYFPDPATGRSHGFVLRLQGTRAAASVIGSGLNVHGQLGDSTTVTACRAVSASGLEGLFGLAAGAFHSLALGGDGRVRAWGYNGLGALGDGTVTSRPTPVAVSGLSGVVAVAAGGYHSLALRDDGTVWAWGWNAVGQLGDRTTVDRRVPARVPGLGGVVAIAAGTYHSVALRNDGTVWAWGWNGFGQLGDGTTATRLSPVAVGGVAQVGSVSTGAFHTLALGADGRVRSWGYNGQGQLGDGTTVDRPAPVSVVGLSGVTSVTGGAYHSLAMLGDGSVRAWGWNAVGQLGDGTTVEHHTAVAAATTGQVASLSAGYFHSVAVGVDGSIQSWGYNCFCQLADGTTVDRSRPVVVSGPGAAVAASAGGYHTLVDR